MCIEAVWESKRSSRRLFTGIKNLLIITVHMGNMVQKSVIDLDLERKKIKKKVFIGFKNLQSKEMLKGKYFQVIVMFLGNERLKTQKNLSIGIRELLSKVIAMLNISCHYCVMQAKKQQKMKKNQCIGFKSQRIMDAQMRKNYCKDQGGSTESFSRAATGGLPGGRVHVQPLWSVSPVRDGGERVLLLKHEGAHMKVRTEERWAPPPSQGRKGRHGMPGFL